MVGGADRFTLIWMVFMAVPSAFRQGRDGRVDRRLVAKPGQTARAPRGCSSPPALILSAGSFTTEFDYATARASRRSAGRVVLDDMGVPGRACRRPYSRPGIIGCLIDPRGTRLETAQ
jgi:hypothetical protein